MEKHLMAIGVLLVCGSIVMLGPKETNAFVWIFAAAAASGIIKRYAR